MTALANQLAAWEQFIVADTAAGELAPDEMTPEMYAEKTHLSRGRACAILAKRWKDGQLTRRKYRNHSWAYRVKA